FFRIYRYIKSPPSGGLFAICLVTNWRSFLPKWCRQIQSAFLFYANICNNFHLAQCALIAMADTPQYRFLRYAPRDGSNMQITPTRWERLHIDPWLTGLF
ncbi:hypothetical protein RJJ65_41625, partial [Rhizobium hidalgonense]